MSNFSMLITSPPNYEKLVVEAYINNEMWFDISQEDGDDKLRITFFPLDAINKKHISLTNLYQYTELAAKHLLEKKIVSQKKKRLEKFEVKKQKALIQIWYEEALWVEISLDQTIYFCPCNMGKWWIFPIDKMWNALDEAKRILEASPDS